MGAPEREIHSLDASLTLLDEWRVAYNALDRQLILQHRALMERLWSIERENHRLFARLCEFELAEATSRIANDEIGRDI